MQDSKQPVLSVSLLVSNRITTIRKCMESIKPLLQAIPSELIVVDTIGEENSDGSLQIVREYTDKIVRFDWCNNFAAARNAGLQKASGEWFLFLDDDEWFENVDDIIAFFLSGEYVKYKSATYRIRDYRNKKGDYATATLSRMVKREKETTFIGTVHEYLSPMRLPCKELTSFVHHYGYVFETEEEHLKHSKRNLSLLRPEFEANPWDMRLRVQMVQECMFLKQLEPEAISLCEETLQCNKKDYVQPAFQWIITTYVRIAERNEAYEEVLMRAEELRKKVPFSNLADVAISIMELQAAYHLEQYEKGLAAYARIEAARKVLTENPKLRREQTILDFDVFLEASIQLEVLKQAIICCNKTNQGQQAEKLVKKRWELRKLPVLTISLLVSNRIHTIKKCMDSLVKLTERIPTELIAIDTVGAAQSDGSLEIVKGYTNQIYQYSWNNDFAAARNVGLEQATGEWFLYLDDDEWFESTNEIEHFFISGEYLEYQSATYQIRNYKNMEGTEYGVADLGRLIHRSTTLRFIGCVHETFSERFLPCKRLLDFVHHYGYVYQNEEQRIQHIKRNVVLLEQELQKDPMNLRCRTQMALELATFDNEGALKFCKETRQLLADKAQSPDFQWQLSLVFCLYEALSKGSNAAEQVYHEFETTYGFSQTARNAISYQMTRLCILDSEYTKAYPYIKQYFDTLRFLQENPEEAQLQMSTDFARYQAQNIIEEMIKFGGFCAWQSGEYQDAWMFYLNLPLDDFIKQTKEKVTVHSVADRSIPWQEILDDTEQEDRVKYHYLLADIALAELLSTAANRITQSDSNLRVGELMEQEIRFRRAFYEMIFREECFLSDHINWMSLECRCNDVLYRFLENGKRDLKRLVEAAKMRPELAPLMKLWLSELAGK